MITPQSILLSQDGITIPIDENNFDVLQDYFKDIFCVNSGPMDQATFNPADEKAREIAEKLKNDAVIVVVGNYHQPKDLPENIIALGRVENQKKLAEYYSMADLCLIAGKRETFSMPVAESLCCGTPVTGFKAGGPETITIPEFSEFAEHGDVNGLCDAVCRMLKQKFDREVISEIAAEKYSKKAMVDGYIRLYNEVFEKREV